VSDATPPPSADKPVLVLTRRTLRRILAAVIAVVVLAGVGVTTFLVGRSSASKHTASPPSSSAPRHHATTTQTTEHTTTTRPATTTTTTTTQPATTTTAPLPLVADCATNQASVVPSFEPTGVFHLLCGGTGEGDVFLEDIHWTSWTSASATGSATFAQNKCVPSCVDGSFSYSTTSITLSQPEETPYGLLFTLLYVPGYSATPQKIPG
jgi:hypothetical protein